jgi:hypothetical protein
MAKSGWKKLQRDLASKGKILGTVDDAHAAPTKQRRDAVMTDRVTGIHARKTAQL